ncbi:threonine--tRNA ligase [Deinococcus cellulosilyticus]|uniref:Threonine--tRNA ligase n=1 Tax=Deinococcus cellulosilyticus (strain DSM 18568 / NBRC 106333 / KACC 11606 / 5516J-15) TaxID=1223518 RepID=A0A511N8X4_DEIC1|nr:threonine--tRNA ligase [Deinococcus cellulosilyticus]GEM49303.1 threonine--tRNA ligase [Deinococcus cellulosilyticus NBRC 106333 = KACC 11606]
MKVNPEPSKQADHLQQNPVVGFQSASGIIHDLFASKPEGAQPIALQDRVAAQLVRHSLAHVLAKAVKQHFGSEHPIQFGMGPVIENGFYYDFDLPVPIRAEDLPLLEEKMREIIRQNLPFQRSEVSREEAASNFADQPYKLELLENLPEDAVISLYRQGDFVDLCRGPHVPATGMIPFSFKLTHVSGAYWKGDSSRPMLQRIYGVAFHEGEELEHFLWQQEEARKRDHRRLGQQLELFMVSEEVGQGLILWQPKGAMVRLLIEEFSRKAHLMHGYDWVISPHIGRAQLWETSGHLDFYKDSMYAPMDLDGEAYYAKPMNCPFHIEIYKNKKRSYRELPLRYAEFGTVYRYELSGALHGLTRVRGFTQDDAHIFCTADQAEAEISRALEFSLFVLRSFGLSDFTAYLSTRPEESVGEAKDWDLATESLRRALEKAHLPYDIDEGGGAFYGPKIDLKVKDALGRQWQLSTIQFDFNLAERFRLEYIAEDGQAKRPFMVHRALFGSMERFFGVLLEHHAGEFPLWLAPVQAKIIPIADRHIEYAQKVASQIRAHQGRAEVDLRNERMQAKIRDAELQKIPLVLVVGDREAQENQVSVRERGVKEQQVMSVEGLLEKLRGASVDQLLHGNPSF